MCPDTATERKVQELTLYWLIFLVVTLIQKDLSHLNNYHYCNTIIFSKNFSTSIEICRFGGTSNEGFRSLFCKS